MNRLLNQVYSKTPRTATATKTVCNFLNVNQSRELHQTKVIKQSLTLETMNPHVLNVQYAVRGPIVARALELEQQLKKVKILYSFSLE
jgi:hypothetical protein